MTSESVPNLLGLAIGLGGESEALRELLMAVPWQRWCSRAAGWRGSAARGRSITASGWASVALLVTLSWVLPWYVLWVLPLAALSSSRRLRTAALVLGVYLIVAWAPASRLLWNAIHFHPENTSLGQAAPPLRQGAAGLAATAALASPCSRARPRAGVKPGSSSSKRAPVSGEAPAATLPPWATAMARTIASPRPGAAGRAVACDVGAVEAVEDALALVRWDAGAVVFDDEADVPAGQRTHAHPHDARPARRCGRSRCRSDCGGPARGGRGRR